VVVHARKAASISKPPLTGKPSKDHRITPQSREPLRGCASSGSTPAAVLQAPPARARSILSDGLMRVTMVWYGVVRGPPVSAINGIPWVMLSFLWNLVPWRPAPNPLSGASREADEYCICSSVAIWCLANSRTWQCDGG
jgi:hypothetical protein